MESTKISGRNWQRASHPSQPCITGDAVTPATGQPGQAPKIQGLGNDFCALKRHLSLSHVISSVIDFEPRSLTNQSEARP